MAQDLRTRVPADPDGDRARADEAALRTTQQRLRAQKEAFQAAIDGAPLEVCLGILARLVAEETAGDARTQFYLADPARTCLHPIRGAGDMPEAYLEQVDGFLIGEESLACGLTTATGRPVVTRDVFAEPLWAPWVHLARAYDFRGCWSFPIDTRDGRTVGTFALYFRMAREPAPHERVLVELVTQTAAIIIARHTEAQELAQAEAALREREARLRKLISAQTVGVLFFTLDGRITDANATFERQSGYTTNELRAISHWGVLTPPEFADVTARAADELAERGETAPYEKQMIRKDGSRWWGLFAPLRLAGSGRQSHCAEFIVDSTERKHAEAALRISEERLRVATHAARIATFEIDVATGLVVFDANILAVLYGLESETGDERPHDWRPLVQAWLRPADAKRHTELLLATMRGEGDLHNELLVRNPASGAETWIEAYATLVRDAAGRPSRVVGIMRNITEQKRAEAERERLAAIEAVAAERQALCERRRRSGPGSRGRSTTASPSSPTPRPSTWTTPSSSWTARPRRRAPKWSAGGTWRARRRRRRGG
jgi:PAS domain S-box-containing protein